MTPQRYNWIKRAIEYPLMTPEEKEFVLGCKDLDAHEGRLEGLFRDCLWRSWGEIYEVEDDTEE
jgi:hypothetical protein